jgi:hypothetical protein
MWGRAHQSCVADGLAQTQRAQEAEVISNRSFPFLASSRSTFPCSDHTSIYVALHTIS